MQFLEWLRRDDPQLAHDVDWVLDLRDNAATEDLTELLPMIVDVEKRLQGAVAVFEAELSVQEF
ncbi:hypothetical protein ACIB24_02385 [Spongisporangium articulatum]|uniref:Uncharacterized protein n=1 Tax=Spongisporangium articulatum TaxID=3362603 RepID=A0ABW8AIR8_9ACTN